jgi:parallel beta-helix repeat protein
MLFTTDAKRIWVGDGTTAGGVDPFAVDPYGDVYNVRLYGAAGDGVANDTAAIQAAIDAAAAAGGGDVIVPNGDYLENELALKSGVRIVGQGGARFIKLPGTFSDTNNAINISGSVSATASNASANVSVGASSIAVVDGSLFSSGDWCLVRDNTWAQAGVAGRNQEIVRVSSVATNTVNFKSATIGAYLTSDTAELVKITPVVGASVAGIEIVVPTGTNTGGGVYANVTALCSVENCKISGANDNASIQFDRSANVRIFGNTLFDGQSITTSGYGYAIIVGESSHNVHISGNHQENMRESAASNRARAVTFTENSSQSCEDTHFNTHGSWCDGVVISNNTSCGSRYAYDVGFGTHKRGDLNVSIIGNTIKDTRFHGISVFSPVGLEGTNISIIGNNISGFGRTTASSDGVRITRANNVIVSGNNIDGQSLTNAAYSILVEESSDVVISGNLIHDNTNGYGITLTDCTNTDVIGNSAHDISSFNYRTTGTNTGCSFRGNVADDTTVSLSSCVVAGNSWQATGTSMATATADDTTPSVLGLTHLLVPSNTGATAITQLDDSVAGQQVTIILTNASNPSTIADSATILTAGNAAWGGSIDDTITLFTVNGGASAVWREISRSAN